MPKNTHYLLQDQIQFASNEELERGRANQPRTASWKIGTYSGSGGGFNPIDPTVLSTSGGLALLVVGGLFLNSAMSTPILSGNLVLLLGLVGLGLGFHAVVGSVWVAATTTRRPQLGLALGALALMGGIAMPVLQATMRTPARPYAGQGSCERNLGMVQILVERYERDTGKSLERGTPDALLPVWNRYRKTHAHAFFCPKSAEHLELITARKKHEDAPFEAISYTGALFDASLRAIPGIDIGPPLLWEKHENHAEGLQVYTARLGVRSMSSAALARDIEAYEKVLADAELVKR